MNDYERELREALASSIAAGVVDVRASEHGLDQRLMQAFPFAGSKIDWRSVRGHLGTREGERGSAGFCRFFDARRRELGGRQKALYLNDNLLDCVIYASLSIFQRHLDAIVSIPAHHYFVAEDFGWCIAYTFEGDIDFGWSPRSP